MTRIQREDTMFTQDLRVLQRLDNIEAILRRGAGGGGAGGGGAPEVFIGPNTPTAGQGYDLWVDTDEAAPYVPPILVTSLPSGPSEGQEVYYRCPNTPWSLWHLRYGSGWGDGYGWEFVGGAALRNEPGVAATLNSTGANVWFNVDANDVRLNVPLAGIYDVDMRAVVSANITSTIWMGVNVAGVESDITGNAPFYYNEAGHVTGGSPLVVRRWVTCNNPNDLILQRFRHNAASANNFTRAHATLQVTPVRVK